MTYLGLTTTVSFSLVAFISFCHLLPALDIFRDIRQHVFCKSWVFVASALLDVIAEQGKHSGREQEDGHKIEYGHETHSQIDDTPCRLQCDQRPGHHYHTCNDAEQTAPRFFVMKRILVSP